MKPNDFEWVPNERLGDMRFGEPVAKHVDTGLLEPCERLSEGRDGGCYIFDDDEEILVYAEESGLIDIIATDQSLIFHDQNLIGLAFDRAVEIVGQEPDKFDEPFDLGEDGVQLAAEFDGLGLLLWIRDGIVVSASVSDDNDDAPLTL